MRKLPLIVVEWDDITTHTGWEYEDKDCTDYVLHCVSVGWQVKSNRKYLVISPMRSYYQNLKRSKCDDRQIIPRGCITKIRRIEEGV